MKKIYFLSILCVLAFASCTKENNASQPNNETDQPGKLRVLTDGSGGASATIVYDDATGQYKANFGGADLVFNPIPNNTNYSDNEFAAVGITCTNCTDFTTNGYTFTAVIPVLPATSLADIHAKLTKYYSDYNDFVNFEHVVHNDTTTPYKQPTLPNYPSISTTYSGTVSGVVVRSHSSPTSCMIKPATFMPKLPGYTNFIGTIIGDITETDPVTGHSIFYDIIGDPNTSRIVEVIATDMVTHQQLNDVTYSGTYIDESNATNAIYKITVKVYAEGVLKLDKTNYQIIY